MEKPSHIHWSTGRELAEDVVHVEEVVVEGGAVLVADRVRRRSAGPDKTVLLAHPDRLACLACVGIPHVQEQRLELETIPE